MTARTLEDALEVSPTDQRDECLRQQRMAELSNEGEVVLVECVGVGRSGQSAESSEGVAKVPVG